MRDLASYLTLKRLIGEATLTASPAAVVIDRGNINNNLYEGIALGFYVGAGGIVFDAANYIGLKLEDCDDNASWAAVTAASSIVLGAGNPAGSNFAQVPDANGFVRLINAAKAGADVDPFKVAYVGTKRYLKSTIVFGGAHGTGTLVGLVGALGFPRLLPAA
ncbi:hypothetical protein [Methylocystis sp. JR02]|uniref:hypothetical protein n=1 Tax=Methylocystis sp. JR02 TaxID=3046284 RepID=UPI0024B87E87|nr:hypothetical protein [Methylocystis sp. JR02]MDJ0449238.1 hypothetical protein [Methylocystis sp. JR02]